MKNEFNVLSTSFSSGSNALNVNKFFTDIEEGPSYTCKSCNRMLYRKSVRKFHRDAYSIDIFADVASFDNQQHISNTCRSKLHKGKISCQAVCNKLQMDQAPPELEKLRKLESILVAQRLVLVLPKGQQRKIKGEYITYLLTLRQFVKVFQSPQSNLELSCLNLKENLSTLVINTVRHSGQNP